MKREIKITKVKNIEDLYGFKVNIYDFELKQWVKLMYEGLGKYRMPIRYRAKKILKSAYPKQRIYSGYIFRGSIFIDNYPLSFNQESSFRKIAPEFIEVICLLLTKGQTKSDIEISDLKLDWAFNKVTKKILKYQYHFEEKSLKEAIIDSRIRSLEIIQEINKTF